MGPARRGALEDYEQRQNDAPGKQGLPEGIEGGAPAPRKDHDRIRHRGGQRDPSPGPELHRRHLFEPAPLGPEAAGGGKDDVAREIAELESKKLRPGGPAQTRGETRRARPQRGCRKDCVGRKWPRSFQLRRADRGAQRHIGGGEDQQRLDEPHRAGNHHGVARDPAEHRKRIALHGLPQRRRDGPSTRMKTRSGAPSRRILFTRNPAPVTCNCAGREQPGDQKNSPNKKA